MPNASITSNPITNYSQQATRRIDMVIGVGYDADLKQAKQVLTEQLEKNEKEDDFDPYSPSKAKPGLHQTFSFLDTIPLSFLQID